MKKFVISVDSIGNRIEKFYKDNQIDPLDFEKVGILGKNLKVSEYYNLAVKCSFPPLSPAELGCTLSHLHALKIFLKTDEHYALVLEDDVIFRFDIDFESDFLNKLGKNLIILLGGVDLKICKNIKGKILNYKEKKLLKVDYSSRKYLYYTMGYIVDRDAANKIIEYHEEYCKKADDWAGFFEFSKESNFYITNYLIHPDIDEISDSNSVISSERYPHQFYIKKSIKLLFKIIFRRFSYLINSLFNSKFK